MQGALLIRLRPLGPWRYGPSDGANDRVDTLYHSDQLYSAVTLAMRQLGHLDEWLDATARTSPSAVAFSSLFPFQGDTLFAPPPASLWPPSLSLVTTPSPVFLTKIRWRAARFVPVTALEALLGGQRILADQWIPDAESGCLLRRDRPSSSPFRTVLRSGAAVDRLTQSSVKTRSVACVEFEQGAGLWTIVRFSESLGASVWVHRVKAAFRLMADTGFGARRTSGWGQTSAPEFQSGSWPTLLMPKLKPVTNGSDGSSALYWLLSLFSPAANDHIDWATGSYELSARGGRVESASSTGLIKKQVRLITEGSVLAAEAEPAGAAVDVAPEGFHHAVYRSGIALALKLPALKLAPQTEEAPAPEPVLEPIPETAPKPVPEQVSEPVAEPTEVQPEAAPPAAPDDEEPSFEI